MNELNLSLLHFFAAGDDPQAWPLLLGCTLALWGSAMCCATWLVALWRRPREWPYLLAVAMTAGFAALIAKAIAARIGEQRPFVLGFVPSYIAHGATGAMPSTHATVMFTVAFALLMRPALRPAGCVALALALATGWARVHVGVHYPMDIAAGMLLGAALAGLFRLALSGLRSAVGHPVAWIGHAP